VDFSPPPETGRSSKKTLSAVERGRPPPNKAGKKSRYWNSFQGKGPSMEAKKKEMRSKSSKETARGTGGAKNGGETLLGLQNSGPRQKRKRDTPIEVCVTTQEKKGCAKWESDLTG